MFGECSLKDAETKSAKYTRRRRALIMIRKWKGQHRKPLPVQREKEVQILNMTDETTIAHTPCSRPVPLVVSTGLALE